MDDQQKREQYSGVRDQEILAALDPIGSHCPSYVPLFPTHYISFRQIGGSRWTINKRGSSILECEIKRSLLHWIRSDLTARHTYPYFRRTTLASVKLGAQDGRSTKEGAVFWSARSRDPCCTGSDRISLPVIRTLISDALH